MEIIKTEASQNFSITNLSFTELKVIRDACIKLGNSGSKSALDIGKAIEESMNDITV